MPEDLGVSYAVAAPSDAVDWELLSLLFRQKYASMVRVAELLVGDRAVAEEIAQDAFVRLQPRLGRLGGADDAQRYLRAIVVNLSRSALRRRGLARRHTLEIPVRVDDGSGPRAEHADVVAALRRLPRRQAECLVLRYYLDLSEAEIAKTLGISPGSVKTHASRGLDALSEILGGEQ